MNNMTITPDTFMNVEGFANSDNKQLYIILFVILFLLCGVNLFLSIKK